MNIKNRDDVLFVLLILASVLTPGPYDHLFLFCLAMFFWKYSRVISGAMILCWLGSSLNVGVMLANGDKMPIPRFIDDTTTYALISEESRFVWLSDIIPLYLDVALWGFRLKLDGYMSIGDLLLSLGAVVWAVAAVPVLRQVVTQSDFRPQ